MLDRMEHAASTDDLRFRDAFESCALQPADFDHHAHVRLAWVYLTDHDVDTAHRLVRTGIERFLRYHGVDVSKYHETITRAWVMAVSVFMGRTPACDSADAFIARNPILLDSKIMLSHYSAGLLFSDEARARFIEPDLEPIPPSSTATAVDAADA